MCFWRTLLDKLKCFSCTCTSKGAAVTLSPAGKVLVARDRSIYESQIARLEIMRRQEVSHWSFTCYSNTMVECLTSKHVRIAKQHSDFSIIHTTSTIVSDQGTQFGTCINLLSFIFELTSRLSLLPRTIPPVAFDKVVLTILFQRCPSFSEQRISLSIKPYNIRHFTFTNDV